MRDTEIFTDMQRDLQRDRLKPEGCYNFQDLVMTHECFVCVGQVQNIDGQEVSLNEYNGKVVLIVNVASK